MKKIFVIVSLLALPAVVSAQDMLPDDNGLATYHTSPRYRESESHPIRTLGYILHPVGWVIREAIYRPISYFASSSETTRSVMGYREPFDYRQPECFSADDSAPDCRSILPFNYNSAVDDAEPVEEMVMGEAAPVRQVYFPDVNFEFDKSGLTTLGRGKAQQIADLLGESPGMHVVLEGHTDYKGSESYNEKLGMKRAETVRKILLELGAPASSVSTVTFGKAQPALSQQTDWARAVNRRVEVHLDDGSAAPAEKAMEAMEEVPAGS